MYAVRLYKTKAGGIITGGQNVEIPEGSEDLGVWRRQRRAIPLLGLATAVSSGITNQDISLTANLAEAQIAFGAGTRPANKHLDTVLTAANTLPTNLCVKVERIKIRICAEDGDTQPELNPERLRQWGHSSVLMMSVKGVELPIGPTYRALDSHNIIMIDDNSATGTAKLHGGFHNGAGQGVDLGDPVVIPPGGTFNVSLKVPNGVIIATAGAAVKVPVRGYLEGLVYTLMSGAD